MITSGVTTFVIPILLSRLGWATFIFFGCMNIGKSNIKCSADVQNLTWSLIVAAPIIWYIYPEVAGKSLEEINLLFTSDSLFVSANMKEYYRRLDEAGGNVALAERKLFEELDGYSGTFEVRHRGTEMQETSSPPNESYVIKTKA